MRPREARRFFGPGRSAQKLQISSQVVGESKSIQECFKTTLFILFCASHSIFCLLVLYNDLPFLLQSFHMSSFLENTLPLCSSLVIHSFSFRGEGDSDAEEDPRDAARKKQARPVASMEDRTRCSMVAWNICEMLWCWKTAWNVRSWPKL